MKGWITYLLLIPKSWTIKLFMNRGQIRLLNSRSKVTDLDFYYSRHNQKLKFLIGNLLFMPYVTSPTPGICQSNQALISRNILNFLFNDPVKKWTKLTKGFQEQ